MSTTASLDISPDVALGLFERGAVLIIAGVPLATEFGIDLASFEVGPNFRGVKMIPPGPHFVYCASKGQYGDVAPRVGFIHYFHEQEIVIREWDVATEELRVRTRGNADEEKSRIRENLKDLDKYLGAYDYSMLRRWKALTDHITEDIVDKLQPESGVVRTAVELQSCPDSERPRGSPGATGHSSSSPATVRHIRIKSICDEEALLPQLKPMPGTAPNFTELPDRCPKSATPSEISNHHMDCVQAVELLVARFATTTDLMAELQFAFVLFAARWSVEALLHWRRIISLLTNTEMAVPGHKALYTKLLAVLAAQMPELPEEMMGGTVSNTVYQDMRNLIVNCTLAGLQREAAAFERSIGESMNWTFAGLLDEDPDDMPVVVEITND